MKRFFNLSLLSLAVVCVAALGYSGGSINGAVRLGGFARSHAVIEQAVQLANGTAGVTSVRSEMHVR